MNTSPLSALTEAIKKVDAALTNAANTFCNDLIEYVREITEARQREIERLEAEALERENAEAAVDVIPFDVMLEKLKELDERPDPEMLRMSAMFWDEDARLLESKISARKREILRAVEAENARQAMKRRKLLHNEGSFPEWAR